MRKEYFRLAAQQAVLKRDFRNFLIGAAASRKDGVIVVSSNGPSLGHPTGHNHAEIRLARKLDVGSIVYVVRVKSDGSLGMAKPCHNCERVLRSVGVNKVYFSTGPDDWDVIELN